MLSDHERRQLRKIELQLNLREPALAASLRALRPRRQWRGKRVSYGFFWLSIALVIAGLIAHSNTVLLVGLSGLTFWPVLPLALAHTGKRQA